MPADKSPVLADAADVLSDQLRTHLKRLAGLLAPHKRSLERRFLERLKSVTRDSREQAALLAITPGAVMQALAGERSPGAFLEHVEYFGRRLAKLNLPPNQIIAALEEYDRLLLPLLRPLRVEERANLQWVREQLQFCVILTLNNSYYQVRETETQAFYELFRVELESRSLDELMKSFLNTLARFCRADAAHLFLIEPASRMWQHKASVGPAKASWNNNGVPPGANLLRRVRVPQSWSWNRGETNHGPLLNPAWASRFSSCWSVPLSDGRTAAGVMQFLFRKPYEWLPREQELLAAAAERCLMAAEKARLVEDLARQKDHVKALAEHMLHVEEAERRRISRELHDEAGQSLLCVRLQLEMMEQTLPEDLPLRTRLTEARDVTEHTILEIRRLIAALSPAVLEQLGLGAALRQLVNRLRRMIPAKVKLRIAQMHHLPKQMEVIVYRLVQECCNNIAKHSSASRVNISAATADGLLRLQVEDDGVGFDVEEALEKRNSFGLAGIRERVALMGGIFRLDSWPKAKETVAVSAPKGLKTAPAPKRVRRRPFRGTKILIELPITKRKSVP